MRKRTKKKPRVKIVRVIVLALLAVSAAILLLSLPVWRIKFVNVSGNRVVTADQILKKASISLDENVFFLNKSETERRIKTIPQIKDAWVRGELPSSVAVRVEERKPFAVAALKGSYLVIDEEGVIIDTFKGAEGKNMSVYGITDLPTVVGLPGSSVARNGRITPQVMEAIVNSFRVLGRTMDKSRFELEMGNTDDMSIIINDTLNVRIGNMSDIVAKLANFESIMKNAGDKRSSIEYVDVRILDNPAVKFK